MVVDLKGAAFGCRWPDGRNGQPYHMAVSRAKVICKIGLTRQRS